MDGWTDTSIQFRDLDEADVIIPKGTKLIGDDEMDHKFSGDLWSRGEMNHVPIWINHFFSSTRLRRFKYCYLLCSVWFLSPAKTNVLGLFLFTQFGETMCF